MEQEQFEPYIVSKSHVERGWDCEREEYLGYEWGGTGLHSTTPAFDLEFGNHLHWALARIASTSGLEGDIIRPLALEVNHRVYATCRRCDMDDADSKTWASIGEGLLRAFFKVRWPELMRQFRVIHVEVPVVLHLGQNIWFVAKPDLILQDLSTGEYWYLEYKTTGYMDAKWINSWQRAVQIHSGIRAAEETLGITVAGCYIEGLFKGKKDYYNNIQSSPFAWGYVNRGQPGILADQYSYGDRTPKGGWGTKKGKGWERFSTSTLVDGLAPWIQDMPQDLLLSQFCRTPPIMLDDDLVRSFFAQTRERVGRIRQARKLLKTPPITPESVNQVMDAYFPQSFNKCEPSFGHKCQFLDVCWQAWIRKDPLGSGQFTRRNLEHQAEFIQLLPQPKVD